LFGNWEVGEVEERSVIVWLPGEMFPFESSVTYPEEVRGMKLLEVVWLPEVLMLTSVRHLSFSRFSPFEEGRPPFVEACIGVLATQLLGTSTGGREGVSTLL